MSTRYPELDEMHEAFVSALANDGAPASDLAMLSHEAIAMDRNPDAPAARTRGDAFLRYSSGYKYLAEVPGQRFAPDKLPHKVCTSLMARNAASWDGPRALRFRYERSASGEWVGGYSIETSREYKELVLGRAGIDGHLAAALRAHWAPGVTGTSLLYGVPSWKEPGPKLKISRGRDVELTDPDDATMLVWRELVAYLHEHGHTHVYYADIALQKRNSELREGDTVQLGYSR